MILHLQMTGVFNFLVCVFLAKYGLQGLHISESSCSTWQMDDDSVNNLDASVTLWEMNECSRIDCSLLCDKNSLCTSFFHHPSQEKCLASLSYKRGLPTDKATQPGWNYYTKTEHCDGGYVFNQSLGLCLKMHTEYKAFDDAMAICEAERAKLVIIKNQIEFDYIQQVINNTVQAGTYIGLRATGVSREWKWWNGQAATYFNWFTNRPDNYGNNENCVIYSQYALKYDDVPCYIQLCFVCQRFL